METFNSIVGYIFSPFPGRSFGYYILVIVIVIALFLLDLFIRIYIRKNKDDKIFRKLFRGFPSKIELLALSLAGYLIARYFNVAFLSMRMFLYLLLALVVFLIYLLASTYLKDYPEAKKRREDQISKNKYLPRKKKRK